MRKFDFVSSNQHITEYVEEMANWVEQNSDCTQEEVFHLFYQHHEKIQNLFNPYPETIFHDEPAKWAELLAINWGVINEPELEFV